MHVWLRRLWFLVDVDVAGDKVVGRIAADAVAAVLAAVVLILRSIKFILPQNADTEYYFVRGFQL